MEEDYNSSYIPISTNKSELNPQFSNPTVNGYFEAFGSIMFAFGGASTFPTIQVRVIHKRRRNILGGEGGSQIPMLQDIRR